MDINLILKGQATVEDMETLYKLGYSFDIEDGQIVEIYHFDRPMICTSSLV